MIYTIGYEGATIESWLELLASKGISCLVDIREIPISRKRGFSKTKLKHAVESFGIKYLHIKHLGSPTQIRNELHETQNYVRFFDDFERYLDNQTQEIRVLKELAMQEVICLLCFERNHNRCHRVCVADRLLSLMPRGTEICHVDCLGELAGSSNFHSGKNVSHA